MGNESLERKIDTNNNNGIEDKELLDFIGNQKNLEELGNYLNAMPSKELGDKLYYITQTQIDKHTLSITDKVKSNKQLTTDEKNIMKLQYFLDRKTYPQDESIFNSYLGTKFGNSYYLTKNSFVKQEDVLSPGVTKETGNLNRDDNVQIIECRDGYEKSSVDKLITWIKEYDFIGYEKARISAETRHINKESKYIKDYVNYDLVNYAFQKYSDIINKKDKSLQKQAGYTDDADFKKQMGKIGEIGKAVEAYKKEKFPNIDTTINQFMSYNNDISDITTKYGYDNLQSQEKATANYKKFIQEASKISKDQKIQELKQKLENTDISSGEQLQEYFLSINKIFEYNTTYQTLKNKYGIKSINTYEKYMGSVRDITTKYGQENIINWSTEIENYSTSLQGFKKGFDATIDWDKYKKYDAMVQKEGLAPYKQSMSKLSNSIFNPTATNSPFFGLKLQAQEKKLDQANTDNIWNTIKNIDPMGYQALNFGASAWNGLVDFIVGTGSSLGLMLQKSWKTDDERSASADFKEQFDSFLKFNLSTEQSKPPLDADGNFDLGIDNTVSQVGSQLANMLALLSGAGGIGKGVAKLGVSAVISQRVGLVSMAFIQNIGRSFQEGINQGLDNGQAVGYAMFQSTISSGLELISPNDMIMGTGTAVAKNYIKNLFTSETKASFIQVGKLFGKNIGKEVAEENMQEALQLAVGNGINLRANDKWNAKFDANFSIDNFAATALLTTLTTGLASSKQALKQVNYDMGPLSLDQQNKIKQEIIQNPSLYQNITQIIDQIKSNTMSIEGVDIQSILQLESELNNLKTTKNKEEINIEQNKNQGNISMNPELLFELSEKEMNALLYDKAAEIKTELESLNKDTPLDKRNAIIVKIETFLDQIKNILSYVKNNYDTFKNSKGINRIDGIIKLVDEIWFSKAMDPLKNLVVTSPEITMGFMGFKGAIEMYKQIRLIYFEINGKGNVIGNENNGTTINIESEVNKPNTKKESESKVSIEIVEANSKLSDKDRIIKSKELLGDITQPQEKAILEAHNQPGEIYNLDFSQIRARFDILQKAGFTTDQIRILMENGICGKNTRDRIITILEPIKNFLGRGEVDLALSYVEKIAPSMEYITSEAPKKLIDVPRAFIDGYLRSKGVAEPSDLIFFLGDIKKLKDSLVCSIQLYTENLGNINKLEETIANAKLPRAKRVDKGCKIIENIGELKLSEIQRDIMQKAILKAHAYGHSETGKNGEPSSIYNYTIHQLGNKMYILMDAMQKCGIDYQVSKNIAKELLRKGICGVTQEATTSDVIKVIEERGIGEDPRLPNSFLNAIGVKKGNINSEQLGMIGVLWSRLNNKKSGEVREIFKSISAETRELLNTHNIDLTYIISDTGKSSNIKRLWNTDIDMLKKCINESGVSVLDRDGILKLSDFLMKEELQKCKTIEDVKNVFIKFPSYEFAEADLPLDNKFKPQMKDNLFYKGTEEIFNEIIKYGITPLEWKALSRHKRLGKTSNMYNETQKIEDKYINIIMNDALKKIPSEKGVFYRGIHISPSKFEAQIVEENGKKIWKDRGYTGSSLTQIMGEFYSGGQILLTIEGKNAKTIEKFWENEELGEAEYLFASGTPFEVVEIQRNVIGTDGKNIEMVVKLKEIDNSETDHK